ncbi:MAG: hypothetical protein OXC18_13415 [Desulfurellaceae bacterium]|nr:hypothetical protein [Desulfurellaceae bacterium]
MKNRRSAERFTQGPTTFCLARGVFYSDEKIADPEIFTNGFEEAVLA